jgi:hypothetical protein
MTGASRCRAARAAFALLVTVLLASGCAHTHPADRAAGVDAPERGTPTPEADSVTIGLWHFDETAGAVVGDAGPFRLEGTSGVDARPDFGRINACRRFQRTLQSFVLVPEDPLFEPQTGFTCEAWINPSEFGQYEDTPIAGCWTEEPDRKSWLFTLGGQHLEPPRATLASPAFHYDFIPAAVPGRLVFVFQPQIAGAPRGFTSVGALRTARWTHVAVTFDGTVVRFYIDGQLDSQYASDGRIRPSSAPLLIGNYLDVRRLNTFGGYLRAEPSDPNPYYAFVGSIDELRISSAARTSFPKITGN